MNGFKLPNDTLLPQQWRNKEVCEFIKRLLKVTVPDVKEEKCIVAIRAGISSPITILDIAFKIAFCGVLFASQKNHYML